MSFKSRLTFFKKALPFLISLLMVFPVGCQKSAGASIPTHVLTADYGNSLSPNNPTYRASDVQWVSLVENTANYQTSPSYYSVYRTAGTKIAWYVFSFEVIGGTSPQNPYYTNLGGSGSSTTVQPSANFGHDCNGDLLVNAPQNSSWLMVNWTLNSTATAWLNAYLDNPTYSADYQPGDYWYLDGYPTVGPGEFKDAVTGTYPDYPCLNGSPATSESAWDAATLPVLTSLGVPIITDDGGQNPDHIGGPFVGQRREGAFTSTGPIVLSYWIASENGEILMANSNAILLVQNSDYNTYPTSAAGQAHRLYAYASFLLTYSLTTSYYWYLGYTAAIPDPDPNNPVGERIFPEEWFVPTQPVVPEPASSISSLQDPGGAYYREYLKCGYQGTLLGRCAIVVNPSTNSVPWPSSLSLYQGSQAHQMVLHNGNGTNSTYCTVVSGSQPCTGAEIPDGGYLTFDGPPAPSAVPAQSAVIVYSPTSPTANSPGVAATGAATQLASAVSGSSSPQTVQLNSSMNCNVRGLIQVLDNNPEVSSIISVPSSTQVTALLQNNHPLGANVICSLGINPLSDPTAHRAYNPLYGMTSYSISFVNSSGWTQIGPNGVAGKSMYVDGFIATTTNENILFGLGAGGCSSPTELLRKNVQGGDPFNFNFVVPSGDYLCLYQPLSTATVSGYINVLQE